MAPLRPFRCDNKPVTQDFNTYYFARKYQDYSKGIPVSYITRSKQTTDEALNASSYESAMGNLVIKSGKAKQMSQKTTAFAYVSSEYDFDKIIGETQYLYRTGVEFTPQELYMQTVWVNLKYQGVIDLQTKSSNCQSILSKIYPIKDGILKRLISILL